MDYYNNSYRHDSLGNMPPARFYQALQKEKIKAESFIA